MLHNLVGKHWLHFVLAANYLKGSGLEDFRPEIAPKETLVVLLFPKTLQ